MSEEARPESPGSTYRAGLPLPVALAVFLPFAGGYFLSYIFRTVNAVIAPELVADIHLNAADLGLLTSVYFLSFALFQLPLGLLLDRFGPRRVEAILLLFAAIGAALFAFADSLAALIVGRAFIGLGVSCCMMASFKAFVMWFPPQRLPALNGGLMTFGALGAITATMPVEWWLVTLSDWRGLFLALAGFSATVAFVVFRIVPDHHEAPLHLTLRDQLGGLAVIFRDGFFWRVGVGSAMSQGASLAIAGLWAGPWLRDVAGLDRAGVAAHLMIIAIAMGVGFFTMGMLAEKLNRLGVRPVTLAGTGMAAFSLVMLVLTLGIDMGLWLTLGAFGFLATSSSLSYAIISQHFPRQLAARANTAQNLLVFVFAFAMQWAIGAVLGAWEDPLTRRYAPQGYQLAFGAITVLQVVALAWFFTVFRTSARPAH
ncbi:MFS transporter [Hydrocarboniclastica marina]|uniref:MFS transporter n=1 Tax=Hydrocarboniclastica marina TaxID=2259620 RepID=A0A4P7XFN7_9ALTE|nr:MFS transporter [Hydrocarboniclastica marina]QCF25254.1 MFS transporter [Hydrocarboniclastica marina]